MIIDNWKDFQRDVSRLIAKAWLDEEFKQRLISDPAAVLAEHSLTVPSGVQVRVNETTLVGSITTITNSPDSDVVYEIPLPPKPDELTDSQIQSWSSGGEAVNSIVACI